MNQSALVVFSGGQDSTTCLFWAMKNFDRVEPITFNYNQRHISEIDCAIKIAKEWDIPHMVLDMSLLNQIAPNALTRNDVEIKSGESGQLPNTFVDGRNLLFLSFASVVAKQKAINHIVTGVCETDFSGYPDCRDVFIKSLNVTLNLAMDYPFVIDTPLMCWAINDPMLYQELMDLLDYQYLKIDFVDKPLDKFQNEYPLDLYCSYTFDQILVPLGKHTEQKKNSFREGVCHRQNRCYQRKSVWRPKPEYPPAKMPCSIRSRLRSAITATIFISVETGNMLASMPMKPRPEQKMTENNSKNFLRIAV